MPDKPKVYVIDDDVAMRDSLNFLLDAANGLELIVKRVAFAHHALRARLIVPEIWIFRILV
jgi:FixJ family two-component response regulator